MRSTSVSRDEEALREAGAGDFTPEMIAEVIRISKPAGTIAVRGIAVNIRPWRSPKTGMSVVFGELTLGSAMISFQVPAEVAPQEGEAVVVRGVLRLSLVDKAKDNVWRGNWKVILVGEVAGKWTPRISLEPVVPLPERVERTSLDEFIRMHGMQSLLVLCTNTGQTDLAQSLSSSGRTERPRFLQTSYADAEEFLHVLEEAASDRSVHGLAIVRGGGGDLDVIGGSRKVVAALISKKMPFYTALGHSTDMVLADRSADQTFHTPSELGAALARAAIRIEEADKLAQSIEQKSSLLRKQERQLKEQADQIARQQEEARREKERFQARNVKLRNLLIGAAVLEALLLYWVIRLLAK